MFEIMPRIVTGVTIALILSGCATTVDEPIAIGKDTYMTSVSHGPLGSGLVSHSELKRQAIVRANVFCENTGKEMQVDSISGTGTPGFGSIEDTVTFMCVDSAQQVHLRPTPNSVIEVH